ncbi:MAG: DNA-binding response regulator [candidate division Zixibacteria bacterium HGW-Zixibacteria-1]|nr:MAG: DNA-binding response regulator [candidate division Zixibacteria bacterium HGW-Zixibacteria-1]
MSKETILIVEDEEDIQELIRYNLAREGFQPISAFSGEDALSSVSGKQPDLILLDLMLPGIDGLEICRQLKSDQKTAHIPIIMVTAKGEEADIVAGLELGADDYLTKPFSPRVLLARTKAVLRRKSSETKTVEAVLNVSGLLVHPGRREVQANGQKVDLTYTEFQILHLLVRRRGWVFTRYQIVNEIKGEDYPVTDRSVDVQIVGLRKKLGEYGTLIETVRGVGYRFKEE